MEKKSVIFSGFKAVMHDKKQRKGTLSEETRLYSQVQSLESTFYIKQAKCLNHTKICTEVRPFHFDWKAD